MKTATNPFANMIDHMMASVMGEGKISADEHPDAVADNNTAASSADEQGQEQEQRTTQGALLFSKPLAKKSDEAEIRYAEISILTSPHPGRPGELYRMIAVVNKEGQIIQVLDSKTDGQKNDEFIDRSDKFFVDLFNRAIDPKDRTAELVGEFDWYSKEYALRSFRGLPLEEDE